MAAGNGPGNGLFTHQTALSGNRWPSADQVGGEPTPGEICHLPIACGNRRAA